MTHTWSAAVEPCKISLYWGCSEFVSNETLTKDTIETDTHWFANYPVSTRRLRVIGYIGADWEFIVNFDLEPLTGRLTVAAALPEYDSVHAWYYYYDQVELKVITTQYQVTFPKWVAEIDIFGQPRFADHNNYPHAVNFNIVMDTESARNLLSESMFLGCYFLVLDKNIPETYGLRAFEGPLWSDQQGSLFKGASYLLPIEVQTQQFGAYEPERSGTITDTADPGGGLTQITTAAAHGFSAGDWVVITGTTSYDGTYEIESTSDPLTFEIPFNWVADDETGAWLSPAQIEWGAWER